MVSYQIYVHLENRRTFQTQIIYDFPAVWNYGKLSAKVFLSSVKVIDTVGFSRFFKVLLKQLLKFLLISQTIMALLSWTSLTRRLKILTNKSMKDQGNLMTWNSTKGEKY